MMLPPPSFVFTTNWLLDGLQTPQKIDAVNLPIQKFHILGLFLQFDVSDYPIDGVNFWGGPNPI